MYVTVVGDSAFTQTKSLFGRSRTANRREDAFVA